MLVLGAGPIGQLCCLAAKTFGASFITVTDIKEERLSTVRQFGANETVNTRGLDSEQAAIAAASKFADGVVDVVIDGVGQEISMIVSLSTEFCQKTRHLVLSHPRLL